MKSSDESIMQIMDSAYKELCKWEVRTAINDNPMAALTFITFLKFLSDNKKELALEYPEKFNFDYLSILFQQKIDQTDLHNFVEVVEEQLGYKNGILVSYVDGIDIMSVKLQFAKPLEMLNCLDLNDSGGKHIAYNSLVSYMAIQSRKELRFSENSISDLSLARLMRVLADVKDGMSFYDFAAGYGLSASQCVLDKSVKIAVQEIYRVSAAVCMMLFVMCGIQNAFIRCGNSLTDPLTLTLKSEKFDRIVADPPFGLKISDKEIQGNHALVSEYAYFGEYRLSGDLTFVRHAIASLNDGGVAVILLPVGALFRGGAEGKIRHKLIDDNYIDTVIELPSGIIPGTMVKPSLLILKKNRVEDDILILDLSRDAAKDYVENTSRAAVSLTSNGIDVIAEIIRERKEVGSLSCLIRKEEAYHNECNLCAGTYLQQTIADSIKIQDTSGLLKKNEMLLNKLIDLSTRFNEIMERI